VEAIADFPAVKVGGPVGGAVKRLAARHAWERALRTIYVAAVLFVVWSSRCGVLATRPRMVARKAAGQSGRVLRDRSQWEGEYRFLPKSKREEAKEDSAYLRNGDRLSGVVERIGDGFVFVRSGLLPEEAKVLLRNVRRISFKERVKESPKRQAMAVFVNGDRMSLDVHGYGEKNVVGATDFSDEVKVAKKHLAGIVFGHEPEVIYEADFEGGEMSGFKSAMGGAWGVKEGSLRALGHQDGVQRGAYLKLRQEGHLRYTWRVIADSGTSQQTSLFFFAEGPDLYQIGNGYQVLISGRGVNLYTTILNNGQHVASYMLSSDKASRELELDYDSLTGEVSLKVDGREVIAGEFTSPIASGDYIIVSGHPGDGFDYVKVVRMGDAVLPLDEEAAEGKDFVLLRNGDRLSGELALISDGKMTVVSGYSAGPLEVPLEEVSSLSFGRAPEKEDADVPLISFRNGDELSGEVAGLEGSLLRVRTRYVGEVEVRVEAVEAIDFRGRRGFFEEVDGQEERDRLSPLPPGETGQKMTNVVPRS